jgi:hypothetical protein
MVKDSMKIELIRCSSVGYCLFTVRTPDDGYLPAVSTQMRQDIAEEIKRRFEAHDDLLKRTPINDAMERDTDAEVLAAICENTARGQSTVIDLLVFEKGVRAVSSIRRLLDRGLIERMPLDRSKVTIKGES